MPKPFPTALVLVCLAGAAQAYDKPPSMPAIDATIVYQVVAQNQGPQQVRVYFGHAGDLLRVDRPDGGGDTVLDRRNGQLTVVLNGPRAFMVIPSQGPVADPFLLDPANDYARIGTMQKIAGLTCEDWMMSSPKGHARVCVTPSGLLLDASGVDGTGTSGEVHATFVSTAPLLPAIFAPPAGYQRVAHPASEP